MFRGKPTRTLTQTAEAATVTHGLMLHHRWMHRGGSEAGGGEMPAEAEGEQAEAADAHVKTLAQDAGERTAVWNNWIRGIHPSTISICHFGRSLVPD